MINHCMNHRCCNEAVINSFQYRRFKVHLLYGTYIHYNGGAGPVMNPAMFHDVVIKYCWVMRGRVH
ncbi:MAG: hypothetical protein L7H00_05310 [Vulcanisaeta sp.]|nr:hypothetical protein [Vulcanisaeta sp.]